MPPAPRAQPALVSLERVTVVHGIAHVLDELSTGVLAGQRIGVVGRNGGGKSTLLRVLAGVQDVDSGRVTRAGGATGTLTVGLLAQDDALDPAATMRHTLVGDRPDHEWAGDPRIRDVLDGLLGGLDAPALGGLTATVGPLSGGERRRLGLARLLVADPDLLLLDEPTNHLDVEGVAWLAEHLATRRTRPGTALVAVTHDRWFLDAVATLTWEVDSGQVHGYDGGYAAYVLAKAERARVATVTAERRDNLLRKELAWLRRGAPARTSKPRFRIDAANALIADEPPPRDSVALTRFAASRLGKDVVDLEDAVVRAGERVLLDRITWRLAPGERVGVVGVNGAGKSTLLRAIAGEVPLTGGRRKVGSTVVLAHLTQEVRELDELAAYRVVEAVEQVKRTVLLGGREVPASQLATRLGFVGARQQTRVGDLSGGERRRLQILRLLMAEPNVLLLDEPTNDLDIETLTSLEDVLDGWAGTLVVVSHDRYLLERVCDRQVALLGDGRVRELPGGVEEYLRLRATGPTRVGAPGATGRDTPTAGSRDTPGLVAPRPGEAVSPGPGAGAGAPATAGQVREARKELARIEKALARLAERQERLHHELADQATDHIAVGRLSATLRELDAERDALEHAWLEAAEIVG